MKSKSFGNLTQDKEVDGLVGVYTLELGCDVQVLIGLDGEQAEAAVNRAQNRLGDIKKLERIARQHVADEMLDEYNNDWNEGQPYDRSMFCDSLNLESITFLGKDDEYDIEFGYDDRDLFDGLAIFVTLDQEGELVEVEVLDEQDADDDAAENDD